MISVSLCVIVKNEEEVLAGCLDSVKDIADEMVIVDTGSTDRTKEIAARYTDKIMILNGSITLQPPGILRFPKRKWIIFCGWTPTIFFWKRTAKNCLN